jgi:hypothetical protein
MSLPIYLTGLKELSLMQTNWSSQINPVLNLPINSGLILEDISLSTGNNNVNHKLGRTLQGWFLVRQRGPSNIYDEQDSNQHSNLTLILHSSANVNVDLFVF